MDSKWKSIGGSDIAAIMGASKFQTAYDVWLRVTGRHETKDNPVLRRGRLFEPVLRTIAKEDLALAVESGPTIAWEVEGVPLRASIDAIHAGPDGREVVEFKTASEFTRSIWADGCPMAYQLQVQWYMLATTTTRAHVVALIGLDDIRHFTIDADKGVQQKLMNAALEFWKHYVVRDVPPNMLGSAHANEYLAEKFPTADEMKVPADEEAELLLADLVAAQAARKEAEVREDMLKNKLKEKIGTHRGIYGQAASVTWSPSAERKTVNWEAVAADANVSPIIIEKHTTIKPGSRIFRVVSKGEK